MLGKYLSFFVASFSVTLFFGCGSAPFDSNRAHTVQAGDSILNPESEYDEGIEGVEFLAGQDSLSINLSYSGCGKRDYRLVLDAQQCDLSGSTPLCKAKIFVRKENATCRSIQPVKETVNFSLENFEVRPAMVRVESKNGSASEAHVTQVGRCGTTVNNNSHYNFVKNFELLNAEVQGSDLVARVRYAKLSFGTPEFRFATNGICLETYPAQCSATLFRLDMPGPISQDENVEEEIRVPLSKVFNYETGVLATIIGPNTSFKVQY